MAGRRRNRFLMAFVKASITVDQVRPQHRNENVRELVPDAVMNPPLITLRVVP